MGISGMERDRDKNQSKPNRLLLLASLTGLAVLVLCIAAFTVLKAGAAVSDSAQSPQATDAQTAKEYENDPTALLAAYRHVEVASVSDAIEQLLGQRMYL